MTEKIKPAKITVPKVPKFNPKYFNKKIRNIKRFSSPGK